MYNLYNKPKSNLIYLASPYSAFEGGRAQAAITVTRKAASLMKEGYKVFCPIAHSHFIEDISFLYGDWTDREDGDFWLEQDFAVLQHCAELWVYMMPGWDTSYGVGKEIEFANKNNIKVKYIEYEAVRTDREAKAA